MSMYNLLHGENGDSDLLLAALGLTLENIGRFRDAWVSKDGHIAIYTRLGGGNSECWCDDHQAKPECYVDYIKELRRHKAFIFDEDDDFDSTYKTFYFAPPDSIPDDYPRGESGDERWARTLELLSRSAKGPAR